MVMVLCVWAMVGLAHGFSGEGESVTLQVQMQMSIDGRLVDGANETLKVRLLVSGEVSNTVIWEKDYEGMVVDNGRVMLTLEGEDNQGHELVADMFDREGVRLEVEVVGEVVKLDMVSQPYAIKSRISDQSHSARGIQGVPVKTEAEVKEGDILVIKDGEWVPMGPDDGIEGIWGTEDEVSTLGALGDVEIETSEVGEVLGYNGNEWVNVKDQQLSEADVDKIVSDAGYIKEVGKSALEEGEYHQIRGIGGKIKVDPMIQLKDNVEIEGDVLMGGTLGQAMFPISKAVVSEVTIKGSKKNVVMNESEGKLKINKKVKVEGQEGILISGTGKEGRLVLYTSEDEVGFDDELSWDGVKKQLGVGGFSEREGVNVNVDGGVRIGEPFVVGDEEIKVREYVKDEDLARVALSGSYSDLMGVPNLEEYVKTEALNEKLEREYVSKAQMGVEIDNRIDAFSETGLQSVIESHLEAYDNRDARDLAVSEVLTGYDTKTEASETYVDHGELEETLEGYATTRKIKDEILQEYIKAAEVSAVGKSGSYKDITDWPEVVYGEEYALDKAMFDERYATKVEMNNQVEENGERMRGEMLQEVATNFVSKQQLIDEQFAKQSSVDGLSNVARSGQYGDVLGTPDLSVYMEKSRVSAEYMDNGEVATALSEYIKRSEVSEVGKTGRFEDLLGKPIMSEYQRVEGMSEYVKLSDFENEMLTVQRVGSDTNLDTSGLAKTSELDEALLEYPKRSELSAVAFSGQYSDLLGTTDVIDRSELETTLIPYVTKVEMSQERGDIDNTYFDEGELTTKLEALRVNIGGERDAELAANYYTKSAADEKIASDIESHKTNVMTPAINSAVANVVQTDFLNSTLENYVGKGELSPLVANNIDLYLPNSTYQTDKPTFVTYDYLHGRKYFRLDGNNQVTIPGKVTISDNLTGTKKISGQNFVVNGGRFSGKGAVPIGLIVMWEGSPNALPAGWVLCNGSNGTPNLSGRFIVGYGGGYSIGATGGQLNVTLTQAQMPSHKHNASSDNQLSTHNHSGASSGNQSDSHSHTGTINNGGVAHGHGGSSVANDNASHSHSGTSAADNKSHTHGTSNDGSHKHTAWFWVKYQAIGGSHYAEIDGGHDGGGYFGQHPVTVNSAGGHGHGVNAANTNHSHSFTTGSGNASHGHSVTVSNTTSTHNHALSNVSTHSKTHNHTITIQASDLRHHHGITTENTGGGQSFDNRPPYYALAFIMFKG